MNHTFESDKAYKEFLESKIKYVKESGFEPENLNPNLFEFQEFIVRKALRKGRFCVWGNCGTGKTLIQSEWCFQVSKFTKRPTLILAPLSVVEQTILDMVQFGIEIFNLQEFNGEIKNQIFITNYEQLENIDVSIFAGIALDESSILKNFSGAYRNLIIDRFQNTPYKIALSATPSPNDELEIGNHAEFINVMSSQDMRAMFFTTDKEIIKGEKYRLKKHAEKEFYKWISTWAVMFSKPSDLGFSNEGYNLPGLNFIEKEIQTDKKENGQLFNTVSVSATNFNQELKLSVLPRLESVAEIVNNSTENFVIWIKHNEEGELLKKLIPEAIEVTGSDSNEYKKEKLLGFGRNEFRVLITKLKIAGMGMNWQNCHNQVYPSLDFSFEMLYQGVRRSYRFGQKNEVNIYIITTDTMQNVIKAIKEKQEKFEKMQNEMKDAILNNSIEPTGIVKESKKIIADNYELSLGDCVELIKKEADNSIDYSFFSPPFGALYVFSNDPKDMSNVKNNDEFLQHFSFLVKELFRVIKEGRLVSVHMMQSTTLLGRDGFYSIVDFRGDLIRLFQSYGFYFHAENMIRKDPKTAAIRTKNRQLMHGTTKKDSSIVRPGLADYILTFKKPGENKVPIVNNIPFDLWCKIAEPVWIDINEGDTLEFRSAKANEDERHLTPTQLQPIEWCYLMWTNKGDTVLSPFAGICSEGFQSIKMERKFKGYELKESYFNVGCKNLKAASLANSQLSLL